MVLLSSMTRTLVAASVFCASSRLAISLTGPSPPGLIVRQTLALDLHHFEVFFPRAAFGTGPVHRDMGPGGPRRNVVFGISSGLVIDPSANQAHPGSRLAHFVSVSLQ